MTNGVAPGSLAVSSWVLGSNRTINPFFEAPQAMLPLIRNARPPNIFCSARPGCSPISERIREASASLMGIGLLQSKERHPGAERTMPAIAFAEHDRRESDDNMPI